MTAAEATAVAAIIGVIATGLGGLLAFWRINAGGQRNGPAGEQSITFWEQRNREVIRSEMQQAIRPLDEKLGEVVNLLSVIKDRLSRA